MTISPARLNALLCIVLAVLLAAPVTAGAATAPKPQESWDQPMKIVIVRSSETGCEPSCPEWVMAEGRIDKETPALLASVYAKAAERGAGARLPLVLRSPGGNILAALQMGYFVRARGIDVAVGTTGYEGCSPFARSCRSNADNGGIYRGRVSGGRSYCLSACPLVLAGGVRRLAEPTAVLAVHHWGYDDPVNPHRQGRTASAPVQAPKKGETESAEDQFVRRIIGDYLKAIGNSEGLLDDMSKAPFTSIYIIKPKRRVALALVTDQALPALFSAAALCDGDEASGSCITAGLTAEYRRALQATGISDSDRPMMAALVRDGRMACEPVCAEFIALKGAIKPGTPKRVAEVLNQTGKRRLPVVIDSPGGDSDAAMEIGRMIARRGLDVIVGGVQYSGCDAGKGLCKAAKKNGLLRGTVSAAADGCRGACVLVLAAGRSRVGGGELVLYRPALFVSREAPSQSADRMTSYLKDLKQDALLARMQAEDEDAPIRLAPDESLALKIATATVAPDTQFPADLCKTKPRPSPCVNR